MRAKGVRERKRMTRRRVERATTRGRRRVGWGHARRSSLVARERRDVGWDGESFLEKFGTAMESRRVARLDASREETQKGRGGVRGGGGDKEDDWRRKSRRTTRQR